MGLRGSIAQSSLPSNFKQYIHTYLNSALLLSSRACTCVSKQKFSILGKSLSQKRSFLSFRERCTSLISGASFRLAWLKQQCHVANTQIFLLNYVITGGENTCVAQQMTPCYLSCGKYWDSPSPRWQVTHHTNAVETDSYSWEAS